MRLREAEMMAIMIGASEAIKKSVPIDSNWRVPRDEKPKKRRKRKKTRRPYRKCKKR